MNLEETLEQKTFLIFDLDDTLINTEKAVLMEFNYILEDLKDRSISLDEYRSLQRSRDSFSQMLEKDFKLEPSIFLDKLNGRIERNLEEHMDKNRIKLYPGAEGVLSTASKNYDNIAAVTDSREFYSKTIVSSLGIKPQFDTLITSSDAERKPSTEGLVKAAEECGANLQEGVLIGNSIEDKKAAENIGIPMIQVKREFENIYSDLSVQKLHQLKNMMRRQD